MNLFIHVNKKLKKPMYVQIYERIKEKILYKEISEGEKLPSILELANELKISKNTVIQSYQQLVVEGYISNKAKSGFYVNKVENPFNYQSTRPLNNIIKEKPTEIFEIDFHPVKTDIQLFPTTVWKRISNEILEHPFLYDYGDKQGQESLRKTLALYLKKSRGVHCVPDQIVIGAGTQTLLQMLCLMLKSAALKVAFEDPGYYAIRNTFSDLGCDIVPIPVETDGLNISELRKTVVDLVFVTPSHQMPLGVVMSIQKRLDLLRWAVETNSYIIEDDYDGEFRYHTNPVPSLQALDQNNRVIYMGTFSKSLLPSIRVSYMVLPPDLINLYYQTFSDYVEQTASIFHQESLNLFIKRGHFDYHIKKMRKHYEEKQDKFINIIQKHMKNEVIISGKNAGLHIVLTLKKFMDETALTEQAKSKQMKVYPITKYRLSNVHTNPTFLFGYGALTEEQMDEGIKRLTDLWFK